MAAAVKNILVMARLPAECIRTEGWQDWLGRYFGSPPETISLLPATGPRFGGDSPCSVNLQALLRRFSRTCRVCSSGSILAIRARLSPSTVARVERLGENRRLPGITDTLETVQADSVHQVNNAIA
jgi:hypothetical protein